MRKTSTAEESKHVNFSWPFPSSCFSIAHYASFTWKVGYQPAIAAESLLNHSTHGSLRRLSCPSTARQGPRFPSSFDLLSPPRSIHVGPFFQPQPLHVPYPTNICTGPACLLKASSAIGPHFHAPRNFVSPFSYPQQYLQIHEHGLERSAHCQ